MAICGSRNAPDRANRVAIVDKLGDFECLLDLARGARRCRLLDEHRNAGEVAQNLGLDIASGLRRAAEHGRRADDDRARRVLVRHILDKVLERLEHARVLIRGAHERLALLLQHHRRALNRWVDQRDHFETRAEFAGV